MSILKVSSNAIGEVLIKGHVTKIGERVRIVDYGGRSTNLGFGTRDSGWPAGCFA